MMENGLRFRGPTSQPLGLPPDSVPPPGSRPPNLKPSDPFPSGSPARSPEFPTANRGFDPMDPATSTHINLGVWDYFIQRQPKLSKVPIVKMYRRIIIGFNGAPFAWRLLKDVLLLTPYLIVLYLTCIALHAVMPAVSLYYSSRMFQVIKDAVEKRDVDSSLLIRIAVYRGISSFVQRTCDYGMRRLAPLINTRVRAHFSEYILHAHTRLDVPTFDDTEVRSLLETVTADRSGVWQSLSDSFTVVSAVVELVTQGAVLLGVVRESSDGMLLAGLSLIGPISSWWSKPLRRPEGAWVARVNNEDYVRMQGLKRIVTERSHRKEVVSGNLEDYIMKEYHDANVIVGDKAQDFWEATRQYQLAKEGGSILGLTTPLLRDMPQIIFALRAIHTPASIPLSLAQLEFVQNNVNSFARQLETLSQLVEGLSYNFQSIQNLYSILDIPNQVPDAPPESEPLQVPIGEVRGLGIEFQNVSFKYPGTTKYVIKNMSFKIEPGQLCVIVGENGAAKSTSLKLILRLYEIDEGTILIDGRDIRTIPLKSLRQCAAVLFQDFTNFPLSVRENVAMGSPAHAHDADRVQEAVRLGGAAEFIETLPEGIDTYLNRPVRDMAGGLDVGQHTLLGRQFNSMGRRRGRGRAQDLEVSGGQQQRLALSRTFMRSNDEQVRLWMFDEPSASLDPLAESNLFERLRGMRGTNTMIFSTHRYGGLTRHADLILYLKDARVAELGTHDQLMANDKDYAQLYNVQAQAFRADA